MQVLLHVPPAIESVQYQIVLYIILHVLDSWFRQR